MIVSKQIRAARGALKWSAQKLADEAGISLATVQRMESGEGVPSGMSKNLDSVQTVLEREGIQFVERGVTWR